MNQQEVRQHIQQWVKANKVLVSTIGDITLEKKIGEGGTAIILESAFAGGTAIKFLTESVSFSSTRYKRFLSEYINLVKLVPTGAIVPLYHYGIQDMDGVDIPYIVMERCITTLDEQYRESRLREIDKFEILLKRLLVILEIIHTAGIVHRDIKPKNILQRPNGDWVLGDFGISWFDPDFYDKLANTGNSDRLANWGFSAPEQFRRDAYDKATPCLDLYALGQTLYYCVRGQCIAGSNYPRFVKTSPSLENYDSLIERLVRQNPEERFQSVNEVYEFLEEQQKRSAASLDLYRANTQVMQIKEFDRRLRSAMPGRSGYAQAENPDEINRVLISLSEDCDEYGLWWTRGRENCPASPMKQLSEEIWLIDYYECQVIDLWIHRNPTLERQYVIIHLAPRPSFGIYKYDTDIDTSVIGYEGAGYFQGIYIPREEYGDGYAILDGRSVQLTGAELRRRNLKNDFFILAPQFSVYLQHTDRQVHEVYLKLCEEGRITRSLLEPLESLERQDWMSIYD